MPLWAGFALGVAGSAHCVAMCGPLVTAVRRAVFGRGGADSAALYQAGRLATYATLGVLAGGVGHVLLEAGAGRAVALLAGVVLIASVIAPIAAAVSPLGARAGRLIGAGTAIVTRWRDRQPRVVAAGLGMLHGLLPCGLVYAAMTAAIATGDPWRAAAFMLAFGAGTLPAIVGVWALGGVMRPGRYRVARALAPAAIVLVGVLLLQRGWQASAPAPGHSGAAAALTHMHLPSGR